MGQLHDAKYETMSFQKLCKAAMVTVGLGDGKPVDSVDGPR